MLARVFTIALNTYRESVRARILLGLAGVAFAVSLYSLIVGAFTLNDAPRVVSDLGAASISFFGVAVAVVIGATSLHRELEQKTLFPILARPIRRGEYLVGKYLGILLTIAVFIAADAGLVLFLSAWLGGRAQALLLGLALSLVLGFAIIAYRSPKARTYGPIAWSVALLAAGIAMSAVAPTERRVVLAASTLALLEVSIVAALAMLFSAFSTPFMSALFTIGVFIVGRQADALANLPVKHFGALVHDLGVGLSKVVPNLQIYVPPRPLLTGEVVSPELGSYLAMATLASLGWAVGLMVVASLVFAKRDFT